MDSAAGVYVQVELGLARVLGLLLQKGDCSPVRIRPVPVWRLCGAAYRKGCCRTKARTQTWRRSPSVKELQS